jgi:hypothetical protein
MSAVTDTERLMQASVELIQKDQVIDALLDEIALLNARLRLMELRQERQFVRYRVERAPV